MTMEETADRRTAAELGDANAYYDRWSWVPDIICRVLCAMFGHYRWLRYPWHWFKTDCLARRTCFRCNRHEIEIDPEVWTKDPAYRW